jgi:peptide/nickel transport system ATP-binding protein
MSQLRQAGPLAGGDGSTAVATPAKGATTSLPADVVLSVRDLCIEYWARRGMVKAIRGVSFDLHRGESLALIGESGSGKTTLALALIRLLARAARVPRGHILYQRDGRVTDVLALAPEALRRFRWRECAMVFQGSQNAFNPVLKVWDQMMDTARAHGVTNKGDVRRRATELLGLVQLDPERVLRSFPHEMSGGMKQRVLIAMSLLLDPQVVILDEPTTALDILTQRSIINLLRTLKAELGFSTIFISHDLSLAAELADRVATMYAGRVVELAPVEELFYRTRHPYTLGLLHAVPTLATGQEMIVSIPGSPPDLIDLPAGCTFHPRCPYAVERCMGPDEPPDYVVAANHTSACFRWQELVGQGAGEEQAAEAVRRAREAAVAQEDG